MKDVMQELDSLKDLLEDILEDLKEMNKVAFEQLEMDESEVQ